MGPRLGVLFFYMQQVINDRCLPQFPFRVHSYAKIHRPFSTFVNGVMGIARQFQVECALVMSVSALSSFRAFLCLSLTLRLTYHMKLQLLSSCGFPEK